MPKKFALAVHHLNVAYVAGNEACCHRQVREGIVPLLDLLDSHRNWNFSIEMSGFSIDYIGNHYPFVLERIKALIDRGQIELISATYAPQIWIVFPRLDMLKSLELNLKTLEKYGLEPGRIFFAQENFTGEGIKTLDRWFDTIVVKDDYYYYLHKAPPRFEDIAPLYKCGHLNVLIGWGHLLEGLASRFFQSDGNEIGNFLTKEQNIQLIKDTHEKNHFKTNFNGITAKHADIEWTWYHIGSSERFAKANMSPLDISLTRLDPEWYLLAEEYLLNYEKQGFQLAKISDFVGQINTTGFQPQACAPLLDGSWNMEKSRGGFIWMGINSNDCEDDPGVRNFNWYSRSKLAATEILCRLKENIFPTPADKTRLVNSLAEAWKHQLLAETSDATGWLPEKDEVLYSFKESENVLYLASQIINEIKCKADLPHSTIDIYRQALTDNSNLTDELHEISINESLVKNIRLFGAEGTVKIYNVNKPGKVQRIILNFTPYANYSGIEFGLETDKLIFSPALMENEIVMYKLDVFNPGLIYLPLPNGIIGLREDLFIIKHNEFMNIACCIDKEKSKIRFAVSNPKKKQTYWVLTVFNGVAEDALSLAERINISPCVYL